MQLAGIVIIRADESESAMKEGGKSSSRGVEKRGCSFWLWPPSSICLSNMEQQPDLSNEPSAAG